MQKANIIYKDQITLDDYEIKDGTGLEMYYDWFAIVAVANNDKNYLFIIYMYLLNY